MLELKTLKDHKNNPDAFIYMAYDDIFKLLGTKKYIKLTTYLISALCSLNYKDLVNKVIVADVKKQKHVKNCYLVQDDSLKSLTDKLKIYHVNILKLYKMWYDKSIKKEDLYFKKLCFVGALLLENEWTKFYELLDNALSDFDDELKNEVKEMLEYINDDSLLVARFYDPDKRREFYMEGFREEGRLQGREQGIFKRNLEIVKNMIKKKYKIEDIEEVTGLSKEEILKLKEKN